MDKGEEQKCYNFSRRVDEIVGPQANVFNFIIRIKMDLEFWLMQSKAMFNMPYSAFRNNYRRSSISKLVISFQLSKTI